MKNKKGFTLVELLAVIVILAVILVIAIPRIIDVIDSSKLSSFESSARMIISDAEKQYAINKVNGIEEEISCENTSKLNSNEYSNCEITFDSEGLASIELTGSGKFEGLTCTGNSITLTCNTNSVSEDEEPSALANPVASYSCENASEGSSPYILTYTGNCTVIDDGDGNWRVKFLTSGDLTMSKALDVDIFLVGGGGGGGKGFKSAYNVGIYSYVGWGGSGGGGGYTKTYSGINIVASTSYTITIGAGGTAQNDGSASSFKQGSTVIGTAAGGKAGGTQSAGGAGGSGGGGGGYLVASTRYAGDGGSYGNSGTASGEECLTSGAGQGSTTCEFGEGTLSGCTKGDEYAYAGGGGGGGGTVIYKSASNSEGYGTTQPKACYIGDSYGNTVNCHGDGGIRGGQGGGLSGTPSNSGRTPAVANTGGGGGGGGARDSASGEAGASGIVIIRNAR